MADIVLRQDGQLPIPTRVRYRDMGDGTHALVMSTVEAGGGASEHQEDAPSAGGDTGVMILAIRNDAGGTLVDATGDYAPLQVNAAGQLIIAGGAGGTSMADDAAFAPGATQITPMGAMLDDVAPDTVDEGDAGIPRMSANRNLYVQVRDNAGNERGLNVDAAGAIAVTDGGGSLTVDGGVTADIRDGAGVALTSTLVGADQALDVNIVAGAGAGGTSMVDDAVFTPETTAFTPVGGTLDDAAPDSIAEGDAGAVRMSANRNMHVRIRDDQGNERGLRVDANGAIAVTDGGGALTVDNAVLSVVGGGTEATAQRVTIANDSTGLVSVDDGGGSLTVDNAALSVVGGGVEATAQRVTIANDSTGVLTVDDGGAALSVDDDGGSLTVDNTVLSVVGGGTEATAQRVTIANDSTGLLSIDDGGGTITVDGTVAIQEPLSVDDNGGSLTVDNPVLSVVGGGAEATAQRVTIANDSTGVLSVDDNAGSLTVDGGVTADIRDGAGVALTSTLVGADQALDVNIVQTVGGAGGTSMVDDAVFTPATTQVTPIAGFCDDTAPDSVDEGDAGAVRMSANRNMHVRIRDDAGNERGLNVDVNGDIGVTNAALAMIGGGVEAAALRVTIANNSTGLLSVDDNDGSLTVDQEYHDNLQCNANMQVGDADVANGNPVPVSDAGGSLTVDGGVTADIRDGAGTALTSTVVGADQALDVNIVQTVGGAGGTSMVDDAAFTPATTQVTPIGAMLDDAAPDSVDEGDAGVVRMSANRNLYTTIRDAAGNERGLNVDAAGAIAVTNAVLSVVGGGAEATAQRVTIANDSTGVLSVDDGGGTLTVDGTVIASNTAGDTAHDVADAGNPVKIGARAIETDGTDPGEVAEADRTDLKADMNGRLLVNTGHPNAWKTNNNFGAVQADTALKAAPGANLSLYITAVILSTEEAQNIRIVSDTAGGPSTLELGPYYFADNGGMVAMTFEPAIRIAANTDVGVTSSGGVNHTITLNGYTAP